MSRTALALLGLFVFSGIAAQPRPVIIGGKTFTESYVLAEVMAQLLEARGIAVERRTGLAGTLVAFQALQTGGIDVYVEYSGTISQVILEADEALSLGAINAALIPMELELLAPLGFNNAYTLAVSGETAARYGLQSISDLSIHPDLRFGLSHEFRDRADGWPGVREAYDLPQDSVGIEHGLAYQALFQGSIDVTDAYSTDGDLLRYDLVVLEDNRGFFPGYLAMPMVRADLDPAVKTALGLLGNRLNDVTMRAMNAEVVVQGRTPAEVAADFLLAENLVASAEVRNESLWPRLARNTLVHLKLTGIALSLACIAGLGLALLVYRSQPLSAGVLYTAGLLQTIPSIALLALLIPMVGVGQRPAIIALFLYSLLPIARNSITALVTIDPLLRRVAQALGLTQRQQLRYVYIPLALPHVLAGVRIAAVVSIGTATLAAFIGAGGLGEPIVTGLALNDTGLILQGAVPAALLALAAELVFEGLERWLIPGHLLSRQSAQ